MPGQSYFVSYCTVNVTLLLVPPLELTVWTFLAVCPAPAVIVKVAVTVESFTTVTALAVTPVPDITIEVVPVRKLPVRVTGKLEPRA